MHIGKAKLLNAIIISMGILCLLVPDYSYAKKLFDKRETRSKRLSAFPKWQDAQKRYSGEVTAAYNCSGGNECIISSWNQHLDKLKNQGKYEQLNEINNLFNKQKYIIDPVNWGVPDYWAVPYEFYQKNGDCEDYAISKYKALKALGWREENLRIVVLMDHNLGIHHSVLAAYNGDNIYILDNQIKQVVLDKKIRHYEPIYSINEKYWWRHR